MNTVSFVMIVHDHQPVGNFDGVFAQAYDDAYEPFMGFLESHPSFRIGLHTSGPLLQWIALHRRDYLNRLRVLVERGQVELWGGGFFEPILPAIPEVDRRGQITTMADWLELELGSRPRGAWLTERVWEPGLAGSLAAAGVEYTAVDDAHFMAAGFERDDLWGYFDTEDQGLSLHVFPIHRDTRYTMPFREPQETIDLCRSVAQMGPGRMVVFGDDGEKFGVWPGTKESCYENRWLERFAEALEENPWIQMRTPGEAIEHHRSRGLVYLPTASYHEMQEWSLPPAGQERYQRAAGALHEQFGAGAHDMLRGGHWRNFLARYPEANRLHKRALRASRMLHTHPAVAGNGKPFPTEPNSEWADARLHLWRAQCNCPYWHGVFGGLYLPHLRSALYRELIAAEAYVAPGTPHVERGDVDLDGVEDALLETPRWGAWISQRGARLWSFDDREMRWNFCDTLARRQEYYHRQLDEAAVGFESGESIHAGVRLKEPGLAELAKQYDAHGRDSFLDRWVEGNAEHDWAGDLWQRADSGAFEQSLECTEADAPAIRKDYRVASDGALEVAYTLQSAKPRLGRLEVQLNIGLHVREADDRYIEVDGRRATPPHLGAEARHSAVTQTAFVDEWARLRLDVWTNRKATLDRAPIDTVSLSEGGAERVFQGTEARYTLAVALEAGKPWRVCFRVSATSLESAT